MRILMFLSFLSFVSMAAAQTVDMGTYEVQGTMRGPEVQFIDSDRLDSDTAGKLGQWQLKEMESELLRHEEPMEESQK